MVIILACHAGEQSSILSIRPEGRKIDLKEVLLYPATEIRVCIECVGLSNMRSVKISGLFNFVHVTIAAMEHFRKYT